MNPKPLIFAAFLALATTLGQAAQAQPVRITDPGISSHNYKHPNKAAAAPKARLVVESSNPALAARFATLNLGRPDTDPTPKYAPREVRFVVFTRQRKQRNGINPLLSARNYKTGNGVHANKPVQQEEWICGTM
ncbi:hypothetical protein GCM10010967_26820 [Dyadobacter beijingensis]|uniref:Uncharacterized protein n=1 Tax=Dyadobacter beijingensis TaxID=365489 RepID=A0ABQ2HUW2_9BACT|nr:hypothetical protein [Dyadobacter beijingensis]GGM92295.1 hypothetical protein GCM10010967_26820 [Dyadobacter beijingensis]